MRCPSCGAEDPLPPTISDNGATTCPKCGHRFPIIEVVDEAVAHGERPSHADNRTSAIESATQPETEDVLSEKLGAMDRELAHPGD